MGQIILRLCFFFVSVSALTPALRRLRPSVSAGTQPPFTPSATTLADLVHMRTRCTYDAMKYNRVIPTYITAHFLTENVYTAYSCSAFVSAVTVNISQQSVTGRITHQYFGQKAVSSHHCVQMILNHETEDNRPLHPMATYANSFAGIRLAQDPTDTLAWTSWMKSTLFNTSRYLPFAASNQTGQYQYNVTDYVLRKISITLNADMDTLLQFHHLENGNSCRRSQRVCETRHGILLFDYPAVYSYHNRSLPLFTRHEMCRASQNAVLCPQLQIRVQMTNQAPVCGEYAGIAQVRIVNSTMATPPAVNATLPTLFSALNDLATVLASVHTESTSALHVLLLDQ